MCEWMGWIFFQALEEQRLKQQAQREKERVEEGQKLRRERAAEKAKVEAAALEKQDREKKELEDKKEVLLRGNIRIESTLAGKNLEIQGGFAVAG